tara:strand:- start:1026 stop:1457 length:432 start_codon:yes stop_codon:yes gene_type:complete
MNPSYISINLDDRFFKNNPVYNKDIEAQFDELNEGKEEEKECRICLEPSGNLIVVCECKGSCEYVHKECIETWINHFNDNDIRHNKCEICKSDYNLEILELDDDDDDNECNLFKSTSCKIFVTLLLAISFSILLLLLIILITF